MNPNIYDQLDEADKHTMNDSFCCHEFEGCFSRIITPTSSQTRLDAVIKPTLAIHDLKTLIQTTQLISINNQTKVDIKQKQVY